jgi:TolB-like protein/Tfp pilus assembly protein PilF
MVPAILDPVEPPLGFRQFQYVDLTGWQGKADDPALAALLRAVATVAGRPASPTAPPPPAPPPSAPSRRGLLTGGGAAVLVLGGGALAWRQGWLGGGAAANSIAVLPFANLSGDAAQDYFSDGLSEELRTTLSSSAQLAVAAQTSSSDDQFAKLEPRAIAAKLDVAFLLSGSVRRDANTVRIAARLIEGSSGVERWAQSFDRPGTDVLAVQSEIATLVADALAAKLADAGGGKARVGGTRDARAFDAYARGRALNRLAADEKSDRAALAAFDAAIAIDPGYAAAHAERSRTLTAIANNYAKGGELKALYQQAIDAAEQAVRLVPALPEGHGALGFVLFNGRLDARAAEAPYRQSYERGFGNADILAAYANFAARTGRFADARSAIARAQRLDPLNATVFRNAGVIEFVARDFAAAAAPLKTALALNPGISVVHAIIGDIALLGGDAAAARASYAREPSRLTQLRGLAIADRKLGAGEAAERHMQAMVAGFGDNSLYQQAQVRAQWGEGEAALAALEAALAAGDSGLVQLRGDPLLDPLRSSPRFTALHDRLGFV